MNVNDYHSWLVRSLLCGSLVPSSIYGCDYNPFYACFHFRGPLNEVK